jgi:hypothetical protein
MWAIGPGWLIPAMHLMPPPQNMPQRQNALLLAGHLIYGVTLAHVFSILVRGKK